MSEPSVTLLQSQPPRLRRRIQYRNPQLQAANAETQPSSSTHHDPAAWWLTVSRETQQPQPSTRKWWTALLLLVASSRPHTTISPSKSYLIGLLVVRRTARQTEPKALYETGTVSPILQIHRPPSSPIPQIHRHPKSCTRQATLPPPKPCKTQAPSSPI